VKRHGGRILVDQLVIHGADVAFTGPGESFLAALDGF
jgi:acetolactate synthase-1/2/3 large subunit